MSEQAPAVVVRDLVKRYSKSSTNAVDGVSFSVAPGEIFGLLGPNGAGKTTTVGVMTTRIRPTGGTAAIGGLDVVRDPVRARRLLAVVPQRSNLDRSLSIRNNLIFHAAYHGVPAAERATRADELLDQFGLSERARVKPNFFSGGQEQRVMIARALMHEPVVLFCDEPTTGLDPAARLFVWERLRELRDRGVTLLLTTHDMDEAAALADRVGIMDHGRLLVLDRPEVLIRSLPGSATLELTTGPLRGSLDALLARLAELPDVQRVEPVHREPAPAGPFSAPGDLRLRIYATGEAPRLVAPAAVVLAEFGLAPTDIGIGTPTLEDVFLSLTGRTLR